MQPEAPAASGISCAIIKSLLVYFAEQHGGAALEAAVAAAALPPPVDLPFLREERNWIGVEAAQRLLDALVAASSEALPRLAGRRTYAVDIIGRSYYALQACQSPLVAYTGLVQYARLFNRAGAFAVAKVGFQRAELTYAAREQEPNRRFCEIRVGQFEAVPTLWGLPPARVEEVCCQVRGDPLCRYRISWTGWSGRAGALVSGAVGGAAGALLAVAAAAGRGAWTVAGVLAGALAFEVLQARRSDRTLHEHNEQLIAAMGEQQELNGELKALNAELDRRVEVKTEELSRTGARLADALGEAQKAAEAKSRFVASISHELRTPLTLLLMGLGRLLEVEADDDKRADLVATKGQALLLYRQVEHLLEYSAIDASAARCNLQPVNLARLVQEWSGDGFSRATAQGTQLEVKIVGSVPDSLADVEKVHSAFINLLGNALKFTPSGTVSCRVHTSGEQVLIEVQDTGRGIPPESLSRIFDRFYQAEADVERPQGTGLGLTIARENIEMHGGSLTVVSEVDRGSTFTIALPIEPAVTERRQKARRREDRYGRPGSGSFAAAQQAFRKEARLADVGAAPAPAEGGAAAPVALAAAAPRVLLVEDNERLRRDTARALGRHFHIAQAANGQEGIEQARRLLPDIIVSDVQMPLMDGLQMRAAMGADPALKLIPFVFVTAESSLKTKMEGLRSGAVDYIVKPFDVDELAARIESQVRARRVAVQLEERSTRLAALGQVTAQVVHDMRSPLQAVISGAEMATFSLEDIEARRELELTRLCGELRESIESITSGARRGNVMLDNILEFVRTGVETLKKSVGSIESLLRAVVAEMAPHLASAGVALTLEVTPADYNVWHDGEQLRRALENLLRNARDALGSATNARAAAGRRIWVRLWASDASIHIRVADNGDGLPAAVRGQLGRLYATSGKAGGTGLGLAVTRNVVAAHDGTLSAEEAPVELGAAFLIRLPRVAAKALGNA